MGSSELRKEYEALAPQYEIIDAVIAARIEKKMTQAELLFAITGNTAPELISERTDSTSNTWG